MFRLGSRLIGPDQPCFIIAEAGVNHNGDLDLAKKLVYAAAEAGADAVKFQTFQTAQLVTVDAPQAAYQEHNTGITETQFEMLARLELPFEAFAELKRCSDEAGILFLSSAFDPVSAEFLAGLGMDAFKIPSGELTNHPFLVQLARYQKPMLVSTGMGTLEEVGEAVDAIRKAGVNDIAIFQCVSNYPAPAEEVNLRAMETMRAAFSVPVGYSDHTLGIEASVAAVAAGANLIEKHFTLDCLMPGPDHKASLEPAGLKQMVDGIRLVEKMLGTGKKQPSEAEIEVAKVVRRSVVARRDLTAGTVLEAGMLDLRRPGTGISPGLIDTLPGRQLRADVTAGTMIRNEDLV